MEETNTSQPAPRGQRPLALAAAVLTAAAMIWGAYRFSHRVPAPPPDAVTAQREQAPPVPAAPPVEQPAPVPAPAPPTAQPAAAPAGSASSPATVRPDDRPPEVIPPPMTPKAEDGRPVPVGGAPDIQPPPRDGLADYLEWMLASRREEKKYIELRWSRYLALLDNKDLWRFKEQSAYLLTPREKFCRTWNLPRAYDHAFLDIKYGVTISGPHLVSRMTSAIDVQPGEKVLEIGTGSGYQSAILSYLTDRVYTIEIIEPLEKETAAIYADLAANGYPEYGRITIKADDGYYGWEEYAPFDKIIVTCGIDHLPPELLKQLRVGGIMVIPVGPPGAQVVLKVTKSLGPDGNITVTREDIYQGRKKVPFVPFTKKGGGDWNK